MCAEKMTRSQINPPNGITNKAIVQTSDFVPVLLPGESL